jgi:hypothetical protein
MQAGTGAPSSRTEANDQLSTFSEPGNARAIEIALATCLISRSTMHASGTVIRSLLSIGGMNVQRTAVACVH